MADARRARAERRAALAARVAQTAPIGGPPHRSPSPAANAATGLAGDEQQASPLPPPPPPPPRPGGGPTNNPPPPPRRTATPSLTPAGSSSHERHAPMGARAALLMAHELLRCRLVDILYEDWLDRIVELVRAARGS